MMLDWNQKCEESGKPEEKYSNDSMIGLVQFFYSAGTDTSRTTLTSLLYYLGEQKEARKLVEQDLLENLLDKQWKNIDSTSRRDIDWDRCSVLEQFIKEGQRMRGISTTLFYRTCVKDNKIGKIKIKKGTLVNYAPMFMHHNEKFFTHPERFDIGRFDKEKAKLIHKRAFAPFGLGQRMCTGIEMGQIMMKSVILALLSQFEVEKDPEFFPRWQVKFTLEMPRVVLKLRPREL